MRLNESLDPHGAGQAIAAGPPSETSATTMILLHGRGGSASDMLGFFHHLDTNTVAAVIPQAHNNTWYPYSFLAPLEQNQPYLDSALTRVESLISDLLSRGVIAQQIVLFGFSQGACLAAEYVARHPRRYGAVMALSGGLIGPPGNLTGYAGNLEGTPVFLGACDPDPHVPFARAQETEVLLKQMGAEVELRRYPDMPHSINPDEVTVCRDLLKQVSKNHPSGIQ